MKRQFYGVLFFMLNLSAQSTLLYASSSLQSSSNKSSYNDAHEDLQKHLKIASFIIQPNLYSSMFGDSSLVLSTTQFSWLHGDVHEPDQHCQTVLMKLESSRVSLRNYTKDNSNSCIPS
jgi:hypothetical protein